MHDRLTWLACRVLDSFSQSLFDTLKNITYGAFRQTAVSIYESINRCSRHCQHDSGIIVPAEAVPVLGRAPAPKATLTLGRHTILLFRYVF